MNTDLAKLDTLPAGWREIARHRAGQDNPLMLLPPEVVGPLSVLWLANFHLFPTALALCASVRVYTSEHAIPADAMAAIVKRLMHPAVRANHKFASDLIADLSAYCAEYVRTARAAGETRERRETFSRPAMSAAADLFQTPE